jgi:hypothetical protein
MKRCAGGNDSEMIMRLETREKELAESVAEGARRLLSVPFRETRRLAGSRDSRNDRRRSRRLESDPRSVSAA